MIARTLPLLFACPAVCFLSISAACANIVRFTGFETTETPAYPAAISLLPFSDQPANTQFPVFARNSGGTRNILSEGSPFGTGQYLELGAPNMRIQAQGVNALMTVSFGLFEPSGFTGQTLLGFGSADINGATNNYLVWGINNGNLSVAANTSLVPGTGTLPKLELDRHYTVRVLVNRSGSQRVVNLPEGDPITLESGQGTLLIKDRVTNVLLRGGVFSHSASVLPSAFFFRNFSTSDNIIRIDNFTRYSTLEPVEPLQGFAAWATDRGLSGNPNDDFENDGLSDSLEYALAGLDPKIPDGAPGTLVGTTLTFNKRAEAVANGDVTYVIETSTDLGTTNPWTLLEPTVNDATTLSATLPGGSPSRFARLKVIIGTP
jgi:hypothetical protein